MATPDHSSDAQGKPEHGCNGRTPKPDEQNGSDHCGCNHEETDPRLVTWSLVISGVLVGSGLLLRWLQVGPAALSLGIFVAAIIVGGWMLLPGAWAAVRQLRPNISSLMVIAVIGAAVIGEWAEAATVVFLFGVAEWLEGWADRRARRATEALLELAPKIALVKRDGAFLEVPVDQVAVGETIATKSGMSIPLDGVVAVGESAVNQAPITGESVPVDKKPGDAVFAGTINGEGSL
jgi:Cd2+/Zn2+-exporting ATPase